MQQRPHLVSSSMRQGIAASKKTCQSGMQSESRKQECPTAHWPQRVVAFTPDHHASALAVLKGGGGDDDANGEQGTARRAKRRARPRHMKPRLKPKRRLRL